MNPMPDEWENSSVEMVHKLLNHCKQSIEIYNKRLTDEEIAEFEVIFFKNLAACCDASIKEYQPIYDRRLKAIGDARMTQAGLEHMIEK